MPPEEAPELHAPGGPRGAPLRPGALLRAARSAAGELRCYTRYICSTDRSTDRHAGQYALTYAHPRQDGLTRSTDALTAFDAAGYVHGGVSRGASD